MTVLGIRVCQVLDAASASRLADVLLDGLGVVPLVPGAGGASGVVFPAADQRSWAEIRAADGDGEAAVMVEFLVDDADAYAEKARDAGLEPQGPDEQAGSRGWRIALPGGAAFAFRSRIG